MRGTIGIRKETKDMPMLREVLDRKITLFDYELVKDARDKRLVFFGRFAGYAGMIDTLPTPRKAAAMVRPSVVVNGIYREPRFQRLISAEDIKRLFALDGGNPGGANPAVPRLRVIGDITCDIGGAGGADREGNQLGKPGVHVRPRDRRSHRRVGGARTGGDGRGQTPRGVPAGAHRACR
ncbi:MAG TPA: hypothetical protein VJO14_00075 [Bacteroidota bacterium]|nr:hypothetical protein [Bacteroidota bacterium]